MPRRAFRPGQSRPTRAKRGVATAPATGQGRDATPEAGVETEGLTVTHWFDSGDGVEPYSATVRFRGTRTGVRGKPGLSDTFVRDEVIEGIVPGSGPVSITARVHGLQPGEWTVTAELGPGPSRSGRSQAREASGRRTLPRAAWSWSRWSLSSGSFEPITTRWSPMARLVSPPAVIPGSWTGLVALGVLVGIALHSALLAREGVPLGVPALINVAAAAAGLIGAKLRYIIMHPGTWRGAPGEGWAVGGFLIVMPITALAGMLLFAMPIGLFLDAGAPALFFGVAIGRIGCFFTGCCAGRCTRSRWGVWSSDRRVGARRIPTQLLESAAGLLLAVVTLLIYLFLRPPVGGLIFAGGLAAYALVRRVLLRLRAERQQRPAGPSAKLRAAGAL